MKISLMTLGTRGDVQPYIALGLGLQSAGHEVTLATSGEFRPLVEGYGLSMDVLRGDFLNAAQAQTEKGGRANPLTALRQYIAMARDTLADEWDSARNTDVLVYNSAALGGYHIAEKLGIPAFASFPAPLYSPTNAFPSPFFPFRNLGPFNRMSHRLFAALGPVMYRRPINVWRRDTLGLPPAKGEVQLHGRPVTRLYAYSEIILARPLDWDASSVVCGYWFLDAPAGWQPDPALERFLQSGPPPVYVGFGSMFMQGGAQRAKVVLQALKLAGQRGVLASGWGGLLAGSVPEGVHVISDAPHDWLFPRMSAVVHHGGAGTTGAALRAGIPQVVCPFIGDQPFWGRRVQTIGVGPAPIPQRRLTTEALSQAIRQVSVDEKMRSRSAALGEAVRREDGVARAVEAIEKGIAQLAL